MRKSALTASVPPLYRYDDVVNVTFRNIAMHNTGAGPRIKGRRQGNATIRDIAFQNFTLESVRTALQVDMNYETPGTTHNNSGVTATNVSFAAVSGSATTAGSFLCLQGRPCSLVSLEHIHLRAKGWDCKYFNVSVAHDVSPVLKHTSCEPVHWHPPLAKPTERQEQQRWDRDRSA